MKKNGFKYIKSFGYKLYFTNALVLIFNKLNLFSKMKNKLIIRKNMLIMNYLSKKYSYIINKNYNDFSSDISSNIIWVFWWQGIDSAPFIVQKCVESIKKYSGDKRVVIIDKNNISKYYNIPKFIKQKMDSGVISLTHFSDILRFNLLRKYGGFWIDSTIFFTDNLFEKGNFDKFYTVKFECNEQTSISKGNWCGFFIGGSNNLLYETMCNLFEEYWKSEELLIDYFLIDYFIALCYNKNNLIRLKFDSIEYNNQRIHELQENLCNKFDNKFYQELKESNKIHKLSYKKKTVISPDTFYDVILRRNEK